MTIPWIIITSLILLTAIIGIIIVLVHNKKSNPSPSPAPFHPRSPHSPHSPPFPKKIESPEKQNKDRESKPGPNQYTPVNKRQNEQQKYSCDVNNIFRNPNSFGETYYYGFTKKSANALTDYKGWGSHQKTCSWCRYHSLEHNCIASQGDRDYCIHSNGKNFDITVARGDKDIPILTKYTNFHYAEGEDPGVFISDPDKNGEKMVIWPNNGCGSPIKYDTRRAPY